MIGNIYKTAETKGLKLSKTSILPKNQKLQGRERTVKKEMQNNFQIWRAEVLYRDSRMNIQIVPNMCINITSVCFKIFYRSVPLCTLQFAVDF